MPRQFYTTIFNDSNTMSGEVLWRRLNNLLHPTSVKGVQGLTMNGNKLEGVSLANTFSNHFVNLVPHSSHILNGNSSNYISNNIKHSMFFAPTNEQVISAFILTKNSNPKDINGLQIRPVKYIIELLAPAVTPIFNLGLSTSAFPELIQM